jgi:hypothetical protein
MDDWTNAKDLFGDDIDLGLLIDNDYSKSEAGSTLELTVAGSEAVNSGVQTSDLNAFIQQFNKMLNQSAIAKSTGQPVRTPSAQYKGFAAEEFYKLTLKINALAEGVPNWRIGIYTNGQLPDGSTLSGIDMKVDISIWTRKFPWKKPERAIDYQSKMHSNKSAYTKDINNPQYKDVEFVGGRDQGVNDKVKVTLGKKTVTSDSISPIEAEQLADTMKAQSVPQYSKAQEKIQQLERNQLKSAVVAGAITGAILSIIRETKTLIDNRESLSEEQFVSSVVSILCGTVEGGVRGGAIQGSVQIIAKAIGREIPANSLGAVPIMALANIAVDLGKDLYKCFVTSEIDTDDLLCNTVKNSFNSIAGFGGVWAGGKVGAAIGGAISSAQAAAATGAAIGSAAGPIGSVLGAVIGGLIIGIGANAIIDHAESDAQSRFNDCILEINSQIELEGCKRLYYYCDSIQSLTEFKLSFKYLLPCYNLISDLKEYNLRKKAMNYISCQLDSSFEELDLAKQNALKEIRNQQEVKLKEVKKQLREQRALLFDDSLDAANTHIANAYYQYISLFSTIDAGAETLVRQSIEAHGNYNSVLEKAKLRVEANKELNELFDALVSDSSDKKLLDSLIWRFRKIMSQDALIIEQQYISYEETLRMVFEAQEDEHSKSA